MKRTRISTAAILALGGATLATISLPILAQESTSQRVEITGSSIKRIDVETALPVTIVTREEIEKSGATTASELLDRLSVSNGQGYNQTLALGDSARPGFAGASLRGLGSNTTLILLNGRRLAVYPFDGGAVDLNGIAIGAIERIEVLRDGASALYGTDAIAGVINFITRKDFTGIDASASYRSPMRNGGGKSSNATATFGFGDIAKDHYNFFGNLSYDKQDNLKAADRSFSKTAFLPNAPGGRFDRTSGNTIPASIVVPGVGTVNPGAPNCLPPYSFQTSPTGACRFDYAAVIDTIPTQEKKSALVHGSTSIGNDHEIFAEASQTKTTTIFRISPTPVSGATTFNGDAVLYPAGGKYYPKAINPATGLSENGLIWNGAFVPLSGDLNIFWRSLDAGPRTNEAISETDRALIGAKGTVLGKWDYDTALLHVEAKATERYVAGLLSESKFLNSTGGLPTDATYVAGKMNPNINPFGLNDATGIGLLQAAQITQPTRISKSTLDSVDGHISGEIMQLPAGALAVSIGLEHHTEKYEDRPQAILNGGDVLGGGGNQLPVVGTRNVSAIFGELSAPVVKGVEVLAQFRYDKYSDFGNTTNPKIGLRWAPIPEVLLRASAGSGFRAPTLPNLYSVVTQTNTGGAYNDPYYEAKVGPCFTAAGAPTANFNPTYCNAQLTVHQGGNSKLGPEKSHQGNIGIVLQPNKDISFSVDYWKIRIDGQITIPDTDNMLCEFIAQYLTDPSKCADPTHAQLTAAGKAALIAGATAPGISINPTSGYLGSVAGFYQNLTSVRTSGIDLGWRGVIARTEMGKFSTSGDITYIASQKQDGVEQAGRYLLFGPVVRTKGLLGVDWEHAAWDVGLTYHFQGSYLDQGGTRVVGSYETFDLAVAYKGIKNLTLRAGIQNIADRAPPYSRQNQYFQVGYDPTYGNPLGRTLVLALNYKFR